MSSKHLWIIEADEESGRVIAHLLPPGTKSPTNVDIDAFRRVDGKSIAGHKSWWKFYDFSTVEVFDNSDDLRLSKTNVVKVTEQSFNQGKITYDRSESWAVPIKLITDVHRGKNRRILKYYVTDEGWLTFDAVLEMACHGEIDNARPVFSSSGKPYIRTRRDRELFNNLEVKG